MDSYNVSVVIPTRNREQDLLDSTEALKKQEVAPNEVIIVDDGELENEYRTIIQNKKLPETPVVFTESDGVPSTSNARNTGAKASSYPIVLFLDDDTIISPNYIRRIQELYSRFDNGSLAGIGGFDDSLRSVSTLERIYDKLFYNGSEKWAINRVGIHSWTTDIDEPTDSDWLSGNNSSYKREVLLNHSVPQLSNGRDAHEDIAMGFKLKNNGYSLLIDPDLSLNHRGSDDRESTIELGYKCGQNRVKIFREYGKLVLAPLFMWALVGEILKQFLAPLGNNSFIQYWQRGTGMIYGAVTEIIQKRGVINK